MVVEKPIPNYIHSEAANTKGFNPKKYGVAVAKTTNTTYREAAGYFGSRELELGAWEFEVLGLRLGVFSARIPFKAFSNSARCSSRDPRRNARKSRMAVSNAIPANMKLPSQ